jgi:hypothetical protein
MHVADGQLLFAPTVDRLYVYDNSVENLPPELLFRASEGILTKQYGDIQAHLQNPVFRHRVLIAGTGKMVGERSEGL